MNENVENVRQSLQSMEPDSDYVHTSDTSINQNSGANASRSLDVRELLKRLIC